MAKINSDRLKKIRRELNKLTEEGVLNPDDVVEAARNPKSAMHDQFNWDDSEAAHAYRLQQARALIKRVVVEVVRVDQEKVLVPSFIRSPSGKGYERTQEVTVNTMDRNTVVLRALLQVATILRNLAAPEVDVLLKQTEQIIENLQSKAA
jgi:hypothetical protein